MSQIQRTSSHPAPCVVVLGAGVVGLTTALSVATSHPDWRVELWASALGQAPPHALWECPPYQLEPAHLAGRWAQQSLNKFLQLHDGELGKSGVISLTSVINLFSEPNGAEAVEKQTTTILAQQGNLDARWGASVLREPNIESLLSSPNNSNVVHHGYHTASAYTAPVIDTKRYLRWLLTECRKKGVTWKRCEVASFQDVPLEIRKQHHTTVGSRSRSAPFVVVVNCTGLGSRKLVPDPKVYPIRGHVVMVLAPDVTTMLDSDTAHVIPLKSANGWVECGGTLEVGQTDRSHEQRAPMMKVERFSIRRRRRTSSANALLVP